MKKVLISLAALVILIALVVFITHSSKKGPQNKAVPVKVLTLKEQTWPKIIFSPGLIQSQKEITVQASLSGGGYIQDILVKSGQAVKEGTALFTITPGDVVVRSPFDGRIGLIDINPGEFVEPGDDLVTLDVPNSLRVEFTVPQRDLDKLKLGLPVTLHLADHRTVNYNASITAIDNQLDPTSHTLRVWATLENADGKLQPGVYVNVRVEYGQSQVLAVPESAIVYSLSGDSLYKVDGGKAQQVTIKPGRSFRSWVAIKEGALQAGDKVVTSGQQNLHNSVAVNVVGEDQQSLPTINIPKK